MNVGIYMLNARYLSIANYICSSASQIGENRRTSSLSVSRIRGYLARSHIWPPTNLIQSLPDRLLTRKHETQTKISRHLPETAACHISSVKSDILPSFSTKR